MSDEGRLIANRYRLTQRIGAGAMGVVWTAKDERLHRTVAVKQLLLSSTMSPAESHEAKQRAMREGRIAARLQHPHAIAVYDVAEEDGNPWLIMEYLPSKSLSAVLRERGALPAREAARIGSQVASALDAAHAAGIVHRDVKPGNILLGDDGVVKITDFGISRATGDVTVTATGMLAGSPAYLAPEVAKGYDPGPPADVFSLGSTIYASVEGQPPFGLNENTLAMLHLVAEGKVTPPRQAGPLHALLMRLLSPEPTERPTMSQARVALAAIATGTTTVRALPAVVPEKSRSKRPMMVAGLALVAAAAVGILLVGMSPRGETKADGQHTPPASTFDSQTETSSAPPAPVKVTPPPSTAPSTTTTTTTTTEPPVSDDDLPAAELRDVVRDYYKLLPGDTEDAFQFLTRKAQTLSGGAGGYGLTWANVSKVSTGKIQRVGKNKVTAQVTYHRKLGGTSTQTETLTLARENGNTLIDTFTQGQLGGFGGLPQDN